MHILSRNESIYERYSDKTKCMYFMIKDENFFDKYMTIWEKVSNITKKFNSELTYNKKYLKAEKKIQHKRKLSMLPVILFDSVYKKDGNFHLKLFLEKFIHKYFWRSIKYKV